MRVLTQLEAQELCEHFSLRRDIWIFYQDVWVRRVGQDEYSLALKLKPVEHELVVLSLKPVAWTQGAAEEYVDWLLEKYTAYALRMQIVKLLKPALRASANIDTLSRDICEIQGGTFRRRFEHAPRALREERAWRVSH